MERPVDAPAAASDCHCRELDFMDNFYRYDVVQGKCHAISASNRREWLWVGCGGRRCGVSLPIAVPAESKSGL